MKRDHIVVNGISFNVRINSKLSELDFINKHATAYLPGVKAPQRASVLREIHKLIVAEAGPVQKDTPPTDTNKPKEEDKGEKGPTKK